jgi:site-specific recombinase XerC
MAEMVGDLLQGEANIHVLARRHGADARIDLPRRYSLGDVPKAPTINEVNKLLEASSAGNDLVTIRDYAILSMLIHYGL